MALRKHKSFSTGKAAWLSLYADRKWVKRFAVRRALGTPRRRLVSRHVTRRCPCRLSRFVFSLVVLRLLLPQVLKGTVFQMFNSQKDAQPKLRLELQVR